MHVMPDEDPCRGRGLSEDLPEPLRRIPVGEPAWTVTSAAGVAAGAGSVLFRTAGPETY